MLKIDWLTKERKIDDLDLMKEKIMNWNAGVKQTLHLGGWDEKKKLLTEVVGLGF
jgi:hypothetical protein